MELSNLGQILQKFIADYNKYKKSRKCPQHSVQNEYISEMQDTCILLDYITCLVQFPLDSLQGSRAGLNI